MSMTFNFDGDEVVTTVYDCDSCATGFESFNCPECNGTGFVRFVNDAHAINWSNTNAYAVLEAAGLPCSDGVSVLEATKQMEEHLAACAFNNDDHDSDMRSRLFALRDLIRTARAFGASKVVGA